MTKQEAREQLKHAFGDTLGKIFGPASDSYLTMSNEAAAEAHERVVMKRLIRTYDVAKSEIDNSAWPES